MMPSFLAKSRKELTHFNYDAGLVRFLEDQFLKVSREASCKDDVLPWVWEKHNKVGGIVPTMQKELFFGELFSSHPEFHRIMSPNPAKCQPVHTPLGKAARLGRLIIMLMNLNLILKI
jgi:hypothetical protein